MTVRPPRSICFVKEPASLRICAESPTASIRSAWIAIASTNLFPSAVKIFPLNRTVSGAALAASAVDVGSTTQIPVETRHYYLAHRYSQEPLPRSMEIQ